jgi:hypothetical protein
VRVIILCGVICVAIGLRPSPITAQPPLPPAPTGARAPDDQIEGTIFEYQGKLNGTPKKEDAERQLSGKFRIEGSAVFDVSPTFALPSKDQVKKAVDGIVAGKGVNLKLPAPPQQKRLGEYRSITGGKLRFDFNDKQSLNGIMVVGKKKKTDDVWIGTFTEREGTKVIRTWDVELRPIQD